MFHNVLACGKQGMEVIGLGLAFAGLRLIAQFVSFNEDDLVEVLTENLGR
ncbi:MAG: hypothetical protein HC790_02130 [Acaryochloridaceae cyanobacterium CSU_3_4]|nr:hypothetical protein [Acaryochloridaceae cyanobacterium CSU_3_4]